MSIVPNLGTISIWDQTILCCGAVLCPPLDGFAVSLDSGP